MLVAFLAPAVLVVDAWEAARPQDDALTLTLAVVVATAVVLMLVGRLMPRPARRAVYCGALAPPLAFGLFFVAAIFMMSGLE